jgi:general secretion pathway protein G
MISVRANSRDLRHRRGAFTLIELLLVMVILAILATVVVRKFGGIQERARDSKAKDDIANIKGALEQFKIDNSRYPTTEEGLQALVTKPSEDLPEWKHSYIEKFPLDPWQHPYTYREPGSNGKDYDLFSCGPDGHEGGGDDIGND